MELPLDASFHVWDGSLVLSVLHGDTSRSTVSNLVYRYSTVASLVYRYSTVANVVYRYSTEANLVHRHQYSTVSNLVYSSQPGVQYPT